MGGTVLSGEHSDAAVFVIGIGTAEADAEAFFNGDSNLTSAFGKAVAGRAVGKLAQLAGPFGFLVRMGADSVKENIENEQKNAAYAAGIKTLSEANIPGMIYVEKEINGSKVQIAVDASGILNGKKEDQIWVWTNTNQNNDNGAFDSINHNAQRNSTSDPAIQDLIRAAKAKATADIYAFRDDKQNNWEIGKTLYSNEIRTYADQVAAAKNQEELKMVGLPPLPRTTPSAIYDGLIQREHKKALARAYDLPDDKPAPADAKVSTIVTHGMPVA